MLPAAGTPYRITRSLRITAGSITLYGKGATVLLADHVPIGDQDPVILAEGSADSPLRDVRVEGLIVDANFFTQSPNIRPRGIEFRYVVGARVSDVTIARAYVGLDFGRGCVDAEARRVTVTDYAEDGFDAGGGAGFPATALPLMVRLMH